MAPQMQPPSSPTSLLWAHQMKREHGFLLTRMQKLEAAISRIEAIAIANQDKELNVAEIAQKVQTLAEESRTKNSHGTESAIEKVRKEVTDQFKELDERLEAIINKLDSVDRAVEHAAGTSSKAFDREVEMLKRVKGLEEGMKNFRDNMRLLGRKVDDGSVEQVHAQVQKLMQKAKDAGADHEKVQETVTMLQAAVEAMKEENQKLEAQVQVAREEMGARAAEAAMSARTLQAAQDDLRNATARHAAPIPKEVPSEANTRDSGSDQVPIAARSEASNEPADSQHTEEAMTNRATTPKELPKKSTRSDKKAHVATTKSAHGQTNEAMVVDETISKPVSMKRELAGLQTETSNKRRKVGPTSNTGAGFFKKFGSATQQPKGKNVAPSDKITDEKIQMRIVRKGKGWVEVVEQVDENEAEDLAELARLVPPSTARESPVRLASTDFAGNPIKVKKGRGRPREVATPTPEEGHAISQPPKRGPGRPRKLATEPSVEQSTEQPLPRAAKRRTIEQNDNAQAPGPSGTKSRGRKRKADADAIDETMDLYAPRATRSQRGTPAPAPAPAPAKRSRTDVKPSATVKSHPRAVTPVPTTKRRRGLTGVFSSPISSPPDNIEIVQDEAEVKPAVAKKRVSKEAARGSKRRTIPQLDGASVLLHREEHLDAAQTTKAIFDRDFEM
ncbi:Putative AT hook, DNA-binding protein [Septoria linicola]|uniref:AT hook, DNA-binding protein n=1 Tax=Septoria linicola TaxID=215465 RepID=A0A9Q9AZH8_9PEZI|nr:putative AT hook, DNA-binding protein [Septoria linicola]USW54591.1 Putative AT hook, DNA-binding protein [Septoria linicola]